jgi:hypothetical protein
VAYLGRGDYATAPLWPDHEFFGDSVSRYFYKFLPSQFDDVINPMEIRPPLLQILDTPLIKVLINPQKSTNRTESQ